MADLRTVGVEPQAITSLPAAMLRRLLLVVAADFGLSFKSAVPKGDHEDLVFTKRVFLDDREILIRLLFIPAQRSHLKSAYDTARREGYADAILVAAQLADRALADDERVLSGARLAALLTRSALVVPNDHGQPTVDRTGYKHAKQRSDAFLLDRVGLMWLPTLAKNRLPPELEGMGKADDLFERYFFRLATTCLGFQGRRFGTNSRGRRVCDALLVQTKSSRLILTDCKAASAGYAMDVDDERRLLEYAKSAYEWKGQRLPVGCVVIVSSEFPGAGHRHPFHARRAKFIEAGSNLAYICAGDLVDAIRLLPDQAWDDTSIVPQVDWTGVLGEGLVKRETLIAALLEASASQLPLNSGSS
ncbi:hypothetical protein [Nonomuraea sp. 10N515B]|uniref:hypothetical protein n=1 Tax=Nonomuraea sp. 10N515B TaxID=3457422 RepID=UPI003FCCD12F